MSAPTSISNDEFAQRKDRTLDLIHKADLDALIAFSSFQEREGHVCYLTNHRSAFPNGMSHTGLGHAAFLLFGDGRGSLVAPLGYQEDRVINVDRVYTEGSLVGGIVAALKDEGLDKGRVGIAGLDVVPAEYYLQLIDRRPGIAFEDTNEIVESQRAIKSPAEIALLREAARVGGIGLAAGMMAVRPGASQHDIELAARKAALDAGADFVPRVRVSTGKKVGTLTWPMTSSRTLEAGDLVFLDLIGWRANYGWDNSRVTVVGKPSASQKAHLDHMVEATAWMIDVLKPDKRMEFVYTESRGRSIVPMAHGIGLEICENPWIQMKRRFTLQPGMVLCVEPIVQSPDYGGISIEDTVVVTETGVELLSDLQRVFW